jgi:hypothetical protein
MVSLIDAGGSGGAYARGVVAQAQAAILPEVRRLIDESIGRIAVRAGGNLAAIGIRSALMFDPAATAVHDDPDHEQVIVPLGAALPRCAAYCSRDVSFNPTSGTITQVPLDRDQYDPANWHDEATSSPYVILPDEGDYLVWAAYRPASSSTNPRIPLQLWLYGGAAGNTVLDRDEDTYHQDDEHAGAWGQDSFRTLRLVYADHFAAGTKLNIRFRHFSGATDVQFAYENELGPRLIAVKIG